MCIHLGAYIKQRRELDNLPIKNVSLFTLKLFVHLVGEIPKHVVTDYEYASLPEPGLQFVRTTPVVLFSRHAIHIQFQAPYNIPREIAYFYLKNFFENIV